MALVSFAAEPYPFVPAPSEAGNLAYSDPAVAQIERGISAM